MEWLNDSSCNVLFADAGTVKRAIVGLGRPLPTDDAPGLQGQRSAFALFDMMVLFCRTDQQAGLFDRPVVDLEYDQQAKRRQICQRISDARDVHWRQDVQPNLLRTGLDPTDLKNVEFLWHKGLDFVKGGTPIPLNFRVATVEDRKPAMAEKHVSRWVCGQTRYSKQDVKHVAISRGYLHTTISDQTGAMRPCTSPAVSERPASP